jgi:hypothetical protein
MRSLLIVCLLCALFASGSPARAAHPVACGSTWTGGNDCILRLGGIRLRVTGTASSTGTARVHVMLTPTIVGTTDIPLLECSASGAKTATCTNEILLPQVTDPREEIVLDCRVAGTVGGTYRCDSRVP